VGKRKEQGALKLLDQGKARNQWLGEKNCTAESLRQGTGYHEKSKKGGYSLTEKKKKA